MYCFVVQLGKLALRFCVYRFIVYIPKWTLKLPLYKDWGQYGSDVLVTKMGCPAFGWPAGYTPISFSCAPHAGVIIWKSPWLLDSIDVHPALSRMEYRQR